jgi:tetratricopeptide (TPR) repeat protein
VRRRWLRAWTVPLALLWWGAADALGPTLVVALVQQTAAAGDKSWFDSMSSGIKSGFNKIGQTLSPSSKPATPKSGHEDDATSLKNTGKPGPELYVAVARLYAQAGKTADAEEQYKLSLKMKPDYLPALLGYAQLKDQVSRPDEALQLYQRALTVYPQEASVHNNLGLCYARQGRLDEAIVALTRATRLAPKNALYRNNVAKALLDRDRLSEAFVHLKEVHGEAGAYYNLGLLLSKKGQTQAAVRQLTLALRADPSLVVAQQLLEQLRQSDEPGPRRLPPIPSRQSVSDGPTLPGISNDRPTLPSAPLPPPSVNSAVRPLPRVN